MTVFTAPGDNTATQILGSCHWLKVVRIYAKPVSAQVIEVITWRKVVTEKKPYSLVGNHTPIADA